MVFSKKPDKKAIRPFARCRDCGQTGRRNAGDFWRSAAPRCSSCGGIMDRIVNSREWRALEDAEEADRRKQEEARQAAMMLAAPPAQTTEPAPEPVAQVLESEIEHPSVYVPATAESPYPYEATYPALTETEPETAAETQPEETYPRIQPPATGEPVPYSPAAEAATASEPEPAAGRTVGCTSPVRLQ